MGMFWVHLICLVILFATHVGRVTDSLEEMQLNGVLAMEIGQAENPYVKVGSWLVHNYDDLHLYHAVSNQIL